MIGVALALASVVLSIYVLIVTRGGRDEEEARAARTAIQILPGGKLVLPEALACPLETLVRQQVTSQLSKLGLEPIYDIDHDEFLPVQYLLRQAVAGVAKELDLATTADVRTYTEAEVRRRVTEFLKLIGIGPLTLSAAPGVVDQRVSCRVMG